MCKKNLRSEVKIFSTDIRSFDRLNNAVAEIEMFLADHPFAPTLPKAFFDWHDRRPKGPICQNETHRLSQTPLVECGKADRAFWPGGLR